MEILVKKKKILLSPILQEEEGGKGERGGSWEDRTQPAKKSIRRNVLLPPRFTAMPFHPESSVLFSFSLSLRVLLHYHVMLLNGTEGLRVASRPQA